MSKGDWGDCGDHPPGASGPPIFVHPPLSPRELQRLDVAGVRVPSPGLVRILLEEMLPGCQIVGMDLGDSAGTGTPTSSGGGKPPA